jgi:purine-binding chemotaxis protein CheW
MSATKKGPVRPPAARTAASQIDWSEIHRRLANTAAALDRRTAEEQKRILQARARALAAVPEDDEPAEAHLNGLEFLLASERYAIESRYVREVWPLKELTPLPGTPPFVAGIINVRGRIVSVVDLKRFFDLPGKGLTDLDKVIIIGDEHIEFGLLADAIAGFRRLPLRAIQPSLPTLTGIRLDYLRGIASEGLVILDGARLLADPRLLVGEDNPP